MAYKVKDLIEKLLTMPQDLSVLVFDWRKSVREASSEPSSAGLYSDISVSHEEENVTQPFIAISFDNEDYTNQGDVAYGTMLEGFRLVQVEEDIFRCTIDQFEEFKALATHRDSTSEMLDKLTYLMTHIGEVSYIHKVED